MNIPTWHPGTLLQVSGSYWQAFALQTGVKLDLFSILSNVTMNCGEVAEKIGADVRGTSMLLNALSAMGLLAKEGDLYHASDPARQFLNRNSKDYLGHIIMHHHHLAESWCQMDAAVKSGKPLKTRVSHSNDQRRNAFLMGMYNIASLQAPEIAAQIDLQGRKKLLDLGGGPGTYAIYFCKRHAELEAVVFDLPTTKPVAEKIINGHGLSERITFIGGDYVEEEIPGDYDVVWLSHILHAEGPRTCEQIITKAVQALNHNGMVLVHDFILNDNMDGPLFPALFALNMLQGTENGQSYSQGQIGSMFQKAGLSDVKRLEYVGRNQSGIMMATKK